MGSIFTFPVRVGVIPYAIYDDQKTPVDFHSTI